MLTSLPMLTQKLNSKLTLKIDDAGSNRELRKLRKLTFQGGRGSGLPSFSVRIYLCVVSNIVNGGTNNGQC